MKTCGTKPNNRKKAGTDQIVNELMKYAGEGMLTVIVSRYIE